MFASKLQRMCAGGVAQSNFLMNQQASLLPATQRYFGANEKVLKRRMTSVGNIGKITKAMKMVAASKMKGNLNRLQNGKFFGLNSIDMMFKSDTYMQKRAIDMPAEPKELVIPITTDKGLCGGINSGVFRAVRTYVNERDRSKIEIMAIGGKGASAMKRPFADILRLNICEIMVPFNFPMVLAIAQHINEQSAGKDKIVVFYNEFESAISQILRTVELMPRHTFLETVKQGKLYHSMAIPDKNTANPALYELYVTSNLWKCFLNNACSEEGSRMNAMENASKNSREMKDSLTLQYNYARQARITTELCEIISGASAME